MLRDLPTLIRTLRTRATGGRASRVLWILNHRTLIDYEVEELREHGFEVFVPKTIPQESAFSSSRVDYAWDRFLTIPADALAKLNAFNFYTSEWPDDIREIANRYFETIFVMPYGIAVPQALEHFRHRVVFRAYGRAGSDCYLELLALLFGSGILRKIYAAGDRFVFGQGYEQLQEVEPPLIARRAVTFPVGVPRNLYRNAGTWRGLDGRLLFLCPHINASPYYRATYESFKARFGHLPHAIMGSQKPAVADDPAVLGFRSDEEIQALYRECALMYYPSRELRHLHYTPLEAAIVGMPVIYHRDSLLARLMAPEPVGAVDSEEEALSLATRLLRAPRSERAALAAAQSRMAAVLSPESLRETWLAALSRTGMLPRPGTLQSRVRPFVDRVLRRNRRSQRRALDLEGEVPLQELMDPAEHARYQAMEEFAIDFSKHPLPSFVRFAAGLSAAEHWGRWTDRATLELRFGREFSGPVVLEIVARAYGPNVDADIVFLAAEQTRRVRIGIESTLVELYFDSRTPWSALRVAIPHPTKPPVDDDRTIGLGLVSMRLRVLREAREPGASAVRTETLRNARSKPDSPERMLDPAEHARFQAMREFAIDFSRDPLPPFVRRVEGLSGAEHWGRWTDRATLELRFGREFSGPVVLEVVARAFGPNADADFVFQAAEQMHRVRIGTESTLVEMYFDSRTPWSDLRAEIPSPTKPSAEDTRTIGLGLESLNLRVLREAREPGASPLRMKVLGDARSSRAALRIGVIGNCQAGLWVQALSLMLPGADVRLLWPDASGAATSAPRRRLARGLDRVIRMENDELPLPAELREEIADCATTTVPSIVFPAFHPDITFMGHPGAFVPSGHGKGADWNSRIIAWAYLTGRPRQVALELMRSEVFRALGYDRQWEGSCAHMRAAMARTGLDFDAWLDCSLAKGVFMHGWVHPCTISVAALAHQVVKRDFAEPAMSAAVAERYMSDPSGHYVWPVYPDIALALGVEGSMLFQCGEQRDDLDGFARKCYDAWKTLGLAQAEFGTGMGFEDTDRILAPLA